MDGMDDLNDKTANPAGTLGPAERGFIYAVARRIVGSAEDAEDVTQDALLLAYRHLGQFRGEAKFRTWLYRIAATTALGHLRRARRNRSHVAASDVVLVDPARSPETEVADAEVAALVQRAIATLPAPYREVLSARIDDSETRVAARLGITVANVKIRAHRARKQLRTVLAEAA
jgi:RNA polymerase sigma-70 factor, ECF subfamily